MFKLQNIEIAIAVVLSTTMVSCFGTDIAAQNNGTDFTEEQMTILPNDNSDLEINQDINIDANYEFTN